MSVSEELKNLQLDRLDKRGKSQEQLKKHSLEAHLESRPIDKALYLMTKGDEIQKLSVVENLPSLITIDSNATFNKVLPKIQQELQRSNSEFHIATSRIFQVIIVSHYKTDGNVTGIILQGIESKDPVIANAWIETLLEVIIFLPIRIIQQEILPIAVLRGQCSQATASRITSCKILGKVVLHPNIKPLEIKKDILPTVYSLCQDINYTVRAAICEQIPFIAKGLGANMVKSVLLSSLVELSSDDNANVRGVAVSSVIQILPFVDKETKTSAMVNLVMNLCTSHTKLEDAGAIVLAKDMGLLLTSLESCLNSNQADKLINFYMHLAKRGLDNKTITVYSVDTSQDVKGREYCALNYPAVLSFTLNLCPGTINQIYDIFKALTSDSCFIVRQAIAGVFHEVAQILGLKNSVMKNEFIRLLRDETEEVLFNLVPRISTILTLFLNSGTINIDRQDAISGEISKALLKCLSHLMKGYNWRLTTNLIKEMEILPMILKSDQINSEFTPQIVRCALYGRHKPVRSEATRTLLIFLRWNTKLLQRTWLRDHLIHELAENKCSYTRLIFIELCRHAVEIFSHKYFKENFFQPCLKLTTDRISTVRYASVSLLPILKRMLKLPHDRKLLLIFEQVILNLERNEKDRDVLANLVNKTKEMMQPVFNIPGSEDSDTKEKRLIEEEENVFRGKILLQPAGMVPQFTVTKSQKKSLSQNPKQASSAKSLGKLSNSSNRAASLKSTPRRDIISDMTFLKQHFYTDAGIELPIEDSKSKSIQNHNTSVTQTSPNISNISNNLHNLTTENEFTVNINMTDDVKVNMRRKKIDKSKPSPYSEIPTAIYCNRIKRYSSINSNINIPSTSNKRHSLNIQQKEFSKIPVISKSLENILSNSKVDNKKRRSFSNLPVPVKQSGPRK